MSICYSSIFLCNFIQHTFIATLQLPSPSPTDPGPITSWTPAGMGWVASPHHVHGGFDINGETLYVSIKIRDREGERILFTTILLE